MRYRLRTLLIVVLLAGPLISLGWKLSPRFASWVLPPAVREDLAARKNEWKQSQLQYERQRRQPGQIRRRELAGVRHAELNYRRSHTRARESSAIYRALIPPAPPSELVPATTP